MMKRVLGVCLGAAFLVGVAQSWAEATPVVSLPICQGATCVNFGPGLGLLTTGSVTIGDYTIMSISGATFESGAFATSATTDINVFRSGNSSAAPLDVWMDAVGYV